MGKIENKKNWRIENTFVQENFSVDLKKAKLFMRRVHVKVNTR